MGHGDPLPVPEGWDWTALHAVALREARSLLGDDHTAQDAAQEATLRAWRNASACRTRDAPGPWLRTIARREALRLTQPGGPWLLGDETVEASVEPADAMVDLRTDVGRALARLNDHERVVLKEHYWHDQTCTQIAEAFKLPVGTVKIRLHRAREKLRGHL